VHVRRSPESFRMAPARRGHDLCLVRAPRRERPGQGARRARCGGQPGDRAGHAARRGRGGADCRRAGRGRCGIRRSARCDRTRYLGHDLRVVRRPRGARAARSARRRRRPGESGDR
uniref:Uncharacterized protein n=1 Tax=Solanum lycopersicum TaxID=4081 RepID=A0A494G9B6_SOLLC